MFWPGVLTVPGLAPSVMGQRWTLKDSALLVCVVAPVKVYKLALNYLQGGPVLGTHPAHIYVCMLLKILLLCSSIGPDNLPRCKDFMCRKPSPCDHQQNNQCILLYCPNWGISVDLHSANTTLVTSWLITIGLM